ncbi:MAG: hypothetical protein ABIF88_02370 [archaeon]
MVEKRIRGLNVIIMVVVVVFVLVIIGIYFNVFFVLSGKVPLDIPSVSDEPSAPEIPPPDDGGEAPADVIPGDVNPSGGSSSGSSSGEDTSPSVGGEEFPGEREEDGGDSPDDVPSCESFWDCTDWGECRENVQHRACGDLNDCDIPKGRPVVAKVCSPRCPEDWICDWSICNEGGVSIPNCVDLNGCGTTHNIPLARDCILVEENCKPDIECGNWEGCDLNYFSALTGGEFEKFDGVKSRTCISKNSCLSSYIETMPCVIGSEITIERDIVCGEELLRIYNSLDGQLIANLKKGNLGKSSFNLYIEGEKMYCDYCFNGVLDGDETGIDCGGSCGLCEIKYSPAVWKKGIFQQIVDWFSEK